MAQLRNKLRISIAEQVSCGCIIVDVTDDIKNVRLFPSAFLSEDLTTALIHLLQGTNTLTCRWEAEPGEWRWLIDRLDELIRVRIFWFTEAYNGKSDEEGELRFDATGDVWKFAVSWRDQIAQLPAASDEAGACQPFSPDAYTKLDSLIRDRKRFKRMQYAESRAHNR